jgi:hypothetical protein
MGDKTTAGFGVPCEIESARCYGHNTTLCAMQAFRSIWPLVDRFMSMAAPEQRGEHAPGGPTAN